jgi:Ser/Thr protein kinase RdoA (MazF antagonist)
MDASRIAKEATRLKPLAERVLSNYPLEGYEVSHLATHSNVMFRVDTERGQQLVLRVGTPHSNTRSNITIEVAWLDALNRETSLDVVSPLKTRSGELVVDELDQNLNRERPCVLFTWIPGAPMGEGAGPFGYRLLGQMSASLQSHGRSWAAPEVEKARSWDRVFYYDPEFDPVVVNDPVYGHLFDTPRRLAIAQAAVLATTVIEESWSEGSPQIVHGDLHEWNVHLSGSSLHAFDFEDVMWALPAQDAAISLYHTRNSDNKAEIRDSFRRGYETVLPWPIADESQIDGFHAARQVMLMNYAARALPPQEASDYLDRVFPWLESYVKRYGRPS